MTTLFVRHSVADYDAWRAGFDSPEATAMKEAGGVLDAAVYCSTDDPNDITVTHEFASLDAARAFAGSDDLHHVMEQLGVVGQPTVWFTESV
jgi:quinol monooxygenase YgiN